MTDQQPRPVGGVAALGRGLGALGGVSRLALANRARGPRLGLAGAGADRLTAARRCKQGRKVTMGLTDFFFKAARLDADVHAVEEGPKGIEKRVEVGLIWRILHRLGL